MPNSKKKIGEKISDLEEIIAWFEKRESLDVEEGLLKVKAGAALIKELKVRLKETENEFSEIKKELSDLTAD